MAELYALQEIAAELKEKNATVVAITPQSPGHSLIMREKNKINFDLLSDPGNEYAAKLGLKFALPDDLREVYSGFGIDLPTHNAEDSWTLPMPARFVIGQDGIVRAADVDPDYTNRPEPQKTLDDIANL
ncbi:MAG: peroxiredoxin-like family protein [Gammaproteobacteria bacterium]|nr:peroxiredoxin-like family protein [Gammaproteobacteria bacterium]